MACLQDLPGGALIGRVLPDGGSLAAAASSSAVSSAVQPSAGPAVWSRTTSKASAWRPPPNRDQYRAVASIRSGSRYWRTATWEPNAPMAASLAAMCSSMVMNRARPEVHGGRR